MDPRQHGYAQQGRPAQHQSHNRFSWQTPQSTPPEEQPAAYYTSHHQVQQAQQPHPTQHSQQQPRAFSYMQTPIEHQAPFSIQPGQNNVPALPHTVEPQSPPTPIDPRPQSVYDPRILSQPQFQPQHPISPINAPAQSYSIPTSQTHPALHSPISPVQAPQNTLPHHTRQRSNLAPINTDLSTHKMPPLPQTPYSHKSQASPLPQKTPMTPGSATFPPKHDPDHAALTSPTSKKSHAMEPYSPHGFSTPKHAVFSPDAATGPNGLDFALHQPGQIAHPNMDLSSKGTHHEWKHSLCECSGDVGTCITGLLCPCVLYGRTAYRLNQKSAKKDPTDMLAHQSVNGHCGLMAAGCGVWCTYSPSLSPSASLPHSHTY